MAKAYSTKTDLYTPGRNRSKLYRRFNIFIWKEQTFIKVIAIALLLAAIFYPYPQIAMWLGFAFAGYSAIANDSIQTIGTFIASNGDKKWWILWLFIGTIFVGTVAYSWYVFDGDVTYQRLSTKGFQNAPESFNFLQIAAPIILLILTRLRMPVSTTFLLLSAFSTSGDAIFGVLEKSLKGYVVAFTVSIFVWFVFSGLFKKLVKGKPHPAWTIAQWVTSGALWSVWIMQDAANIAIYLPRSLNLWQFIAFAAYIFFGLGILFYLRGDRIQKVVKEKSDVVDVRSATVIDFVYTLILFVFQSVSVIPMSTTWVFIGLLGGRELAIRATMVDKKPKRMQKAFKLILRDVVYALIGLAISIILAIAVNPNIQESILEFFRD